MSTPSAEPGVRARGRRTDLALSLVLAVVVLGPVLVRRGYVLRGDMVFVPDQPWKGSWLGLDGRVARFVPGDAFLAAAGSVLPGDLVQKLVLLGAFVIGGWGAGRLVGDRGSVARAAAITLFVWNPWVAERLGIGQWGVVVGYLLLPWVALAAVRVRDADGLAHRRAWPALVVWLGISAVFSPAAGLVALASVTGLLVVGRRWRRTAGALLVGLLVNLPWILPSLLHRELLEPSAGQFPAFASRAESSLGVVASVLSFGGIWKASVVPHERSVALLVGLSLVITVVGLCGLRSAARDGDRATVVGLGVVGAGSVALALATAVPGVADALDRAATAVPALGILRDSHRYLGPAVLALLPGIAAATSWIGDRAVRGREALRLAALLVVVAPVLVLPSLAWGLGDDWHPVAYPSEWSSVRDEVPPGRTVVLPWRGGYRGFGWNGHRAVLDPAPRFFPGDVLIDDRLVLPGGTLTSEDPLLRAVARAVESPDATAALRRLGVRSVLEEKGNGVPSPPLRGRVLHDGRELRLTDLGPVATRPPESTFAWQRRVILGVDAAVLLAWLVACGLALRAAIPATADPACRVSPRR